MGGRLTNKVALITGGGSGIGRGIARAFLAEGASVVISGRHGEKLEQVQREEAEQSGSIAYVVGDVSLARDAQKMVETTVELHGKLDILVNNAGVRANIGTILELSESEWDRTFDVDAKGSWLCSKYAIPRMRQNGGGAIIMINSISSFVGQPRQGCYNAAKAAQLALMRCMAIDFALDNIRVNAVAPAWVETEMNRHQLDEMRSSPQKRFPPGISYQDLLALHPIGRIGTPPDIAGTVVFLASDDSSWITGTTVTVDGGYTCQ